MRLKISLARSILYMTDFNTHNFAADISIDVDLGSTLPDDVMHFIKSAKLRRGEALIGELNHQHTQRLSAMSVSAAKYGIR